MPGPIVIQSTSLLLVEGNDDKLFFERLLKHIGISLVQVETAAQKRFAELIKVILNGPGGSSLDRLAVIADADTSRDRRFASYRHHLKAAGLPCPEAVNTWTTAEWGSVGICVVPGGESGMLEDLALATVDGHPAMACVDTFMECLGQKLKQKPAEEPNDPHEPYFPANPSKSRAQAFLAAMYRTNPHIGIAAQNGYWNMGHSCLDDVKRFLIEGFASDRPG